MLDERPYQRRISDDPVTVSSATFPTRSVLTGSEVQLESDSNLIQNEQVVG